MTDNYAKQRLFYRHNSVNSFKKWHPDIEVIILNDELLKGYDMTTHFYSGGLSRFLFIRDLFKKGYTKVISLGADTITCSRLDEFLDDNHTPMLCTLDFKNKLPPEMYPTEIQPLFIPTHGVFEWPTINSDVSCINNPDIITKMEKLCHEKQLHEQGAMNFIYPNGIKIVDYPHEFSTVVYNNRAKGWLGTGCIVNGSLHFGFDGAKIGEFNPMLVWKPIGSKLFNHIGKHVKVFHFACQNTNDDPTQTWFNKETITFFETHCACDWSLPWNLPHVFMYPKGHGLANILIMLTDFFHAHPNGLVHESIKDNEISRWLNLNFKLTDRTDLPVYEPKIIINDFTIKNVHPLIRKLMSPSQELERELEKYSLDGIKLGIHVRRGGACQDSVKVVNPPTDSFASDEAVDRMVQIAARHNGNVFLASDSPSTKKKFNARSLDINISILHGQEDRLGIFLDFFLLSKCPEIIVTGGNFPNHPGLSTFGYMAAIYGNKPFTIFRNE
jgi:hypothetical protein